MTTVLLLASFWFYALGLYDLIVLDRFYNGWFLIIGGLVTFWGRMLLLGSDEE